MKKNNRSRRIDEMTEDDVVVTSDSTTTVAGKPRSAAVYLLLAFFFGFLGIHNFYAGYVWRGLIQLLMTLFAAVFMFIPLLIVGIWVFLEICFVRTDVHGIDFIPSPILRIVAIVAYLFSLFSFSYFYAPTNIWVIETVPARTNMAS